MALIRDYGAVGDTEEAELAARGIDIHEELDWGRLAGRNINWGRFQGTCPFIFLDDRGWRFHLPAMLSDLTSACVAEGSYDGAADYHLLRVVLDVAPGKYPDGSIIASRLGHRLACLNDGQRRALLAFLELAADAVMVSIIEDCAAGGSAVGRRWKRFEERSAVWVGLRRMAAAVAPPNAPVVRTRLDGARTTLPSPVLGRIGGPDIDVELLT